MNNKQLMLKDLAKSGLTAVDAKVMQLKPLAPEEMEKIFDGASVPAYAIPYFDLNGSYREYSRFKLLDDFIPKGQKKSAKYLQIPGTKPHFYFAPFCNWKTIAADPKIPLYIVEGEKKAAALTKLGYPAIGLGGIWSWRSRENEISDRISDFNLINWENRKTIIAFDADV